MYKFVVSRVIDPLNDPGILLLMYLKTKYKTRKRLYNELLLNTR